MCARWGERLHFSWGVECLFLLGYIIGKKKRGGVLGGLLKKKKKKKMVFHRKNKIQNPFLFF